MQTNISELFKENDKDSSIIKSLIVISLVLFASLVAPKLPASYLEIIDNMIVKFLLFTGIAYLATCDLVSAIIASIAVMTTLQTLSVHKITNKVIDATKDLLKENQKVIDATKDLFKENQVQDQIQLNNNYSIDFSASLNPPVNIIGDLSNSMSITSSNNMSDTSSNNMSDTSSNNMSDTSSIVNMINTTNNMSDTSSIVNMINTTNNITDTSSNNMSEPKNIITQTVIMSSEEDPYLKLRDFLNNVKESDPTINLDSLLSAVINSNPNLDKSFVKEIINTTFSSQPVIQQVSQQVSQPVIQPVSQQVSQPVVQQVSQPVSQQVSQQVSQTVVKPVVQPVVQPVIQQAVQPVVQPVIQPVIQQAVQPSDQPLGYQNFNNNLVVDDTIQIKHPRRIKTEPKIQPIEKNNDPYAMLEDNLQYYAYSNY
jgi:hypothetical protein